MSAFVIGAVSGVVASFLIYSVFAFIGDIAASRRVKEFCDTFGLMKGVAFYDKVKIDDPEVKKRLSDATAKYIAASQEHEKELASIMDDYEKKKTKAEGGEEEK